MLNSVRIFSMLCIWFLSFVPGVHAHDLGIARVEIQKLDEHRLAVNAKLSATIESPADPILGEGCEIQRRLSGAVNSNTSWYRWLLACPGSIAGDLLLEWPLDGALIVFEKSVGDSVHQYLRSQGESISISLQALARDSDSLGQSLDYLESGFVHILVGYDHLMFVALLAMLAHSWQLLKLVTAFTIGHSITLGLAILGILQIPVPPVEVLIALSIMLLARSVIKNSWDTRNGFALVVAFGLIHGLGFASVMETGGLSGMPLVHALFFFNLGIELGQIVFIVIFLMLMKLLRLTFVRPLKLEHGIATVTGVVGAFLVVDRTTQFINF